MSTIFQQLGLDQTFFTQFFVIFATFILLRTTYFKPFLKMIKLREEKTVESMKRAEALKDEVKKGIEEYKRILSEEQKKTREELEFLMADARKKEAEIIKNAQDQVRQITQKTFDEIEKHKHDLTHSLEVEVESLAHKISENLLGRRS